MIQNVKEIIIGDPNLRCGENESDVKSHQRKLSNRKSKHRFN